jgi:transcriptional regulator with XRE-family HTH domain
MDDGNAGDAKGDLDQQVGRALRGARAQSGLTLAELSSRSGVSTAMISKIERGQVSPSLVTLNALARAMGLPIINFFAATIEINEAALVRKGEGITVRRAGSTYGQTYRQLGRIETDGNEFESFIITLESPVQGTPIFQHPGVELMHLLEGDLTYRIGEDTYTLLPGDTLTFEANVPHGPVHMNSARTVFLTVISRPK